ncbi:MAG: orotidine-5'-phosphate decarboxylase [Gemmatimonadaceae bacterium]
MTASEPIDVRTMDAQTAWNERIHGVAPIVALDVPTFADARALVSELGTSCYFYKVGLELFAAEGPPVVKWLREQNKKVFVDLKLHDIPNTVCSAARAIAALGTTLLTVHASGGEAMIRAAVEGANEGSASGRPCAVLAVTLLTSLDAEAVNATWGRGDVSIETEVVRLAGIALRGGARGVVCSGAELPALKQRFGDEIFTLVPGVRLAGGDAHDQMRVITPASAMNAGADWLVLGRAVTAAPDRLKAMEAVWRELNVG